MYCCMHFVDNLKVDSDSKWDKYFSDQKVGGTDTTTTHQTKFGIFREGFNSLWQDIVNFGKWLTGDEC